MRKKGVVKMTKKECLDKIEEHKNPIWCKVLERAEAILDSGFVEYHAFENNYLLPNLITEACLHYVAKQYHPSNLTKEEKDTLRNFYDL